MLLLVPLVGECGEVFDASQYVFFGKNAAEEVELGGLEDEDEYKAMLAVEFSEDDLFINKEEAEDIRSLSDIDDLTTTFLKPQFQSSVPVCVLNCYPSYDDLFLGFKPNRTH
ncbi:hypothetical protein V8G54_022952 [Vigna mungo]|uniref:Uncharacterized protein n=1 Tax=Vigna mungo TaxID=3915 RepID=A0AAQ3RS41_VIGMU